MTDPDAAAPAVEPPDYPRVVIRKDLRAGVTVLGAVAMLGLPLGWLWSALAPPEVVRTGGGGDTATPLLSQTEHRFDALALFVLLGLAAGVLTGVVVWLLREYRGPVLVIAATAGGLVAAWLALRTGELLTVDGLVATAAGQFAARAPTVESSWAVVAQPLGVALAYSFAVASNGHDDLGRTRS
ncbi:MAG: DUF2567 domain-containing protein [Pseudonocardiaceae bacterium]|nr:DUF2567 domain-containing protein [Pseudonocardiaceae bacterium]